MERPPTRFARSGDAMIAYQVGGEGDLDLVAVGGPASHLDLQWEEPFTASGVERLASFARVLGFRPRGTGPPRPADAAPTLEQQMDDMRAVLDAAGFDRVAV